MKSTGAKFTDAEKRFRSSGGINESLSLKSAEAITIYHAYISSGCSLNRAEKTNDLLRYTLKSRNEVVDGLIKLNMKYQKKVSDMMW